MGVGVDANRGEGESWRISPGNLPHSRYSLLYYSMSDWTTTLPDYIRVGNNWRTKTGRELTLGAPRTDGLLIPEGRRKIKRRFVLGEAGVGRWI